MWSWALESHAGAEYRIFCSPHGQLVLMAWSRHGMRLELEECSVVEVLASSIWGVRTVVRDAPLAC